MQDNRQPAAPLLTHKVEPISNGLHAIPMLAMLDPQGKPYEQAELPELSQDKAIKIHHAMVFTRLLDERMIAAQRQGRVSFYLACTGEEGAIVASAAATESLDMIMSQYREQGALVWRGYTPRQFMDQLFSNHLDPNKGRQMPIHYGDKALNFMTISSPLATQIPQAAGYAYGQKLSGQAAITLCYFGEGAASEGDFHAGLNMAAVLKCPAIFLCRNNGYAISTPAEEQFVGDGIASRGIGYGIKTLRVDGNDAMAMYAATLKAREIAIAESCPILIEAMTYRLAAHSTSDDPSGYRSQKEEQIWRERDPVLRWQYYLQQCGWFDQDAHHQWQSEMKNTLLQAMKDAEIVPVAPVSSMIEDVYHTPPWHLQRQLTQLQQHLERHPDAYDLRCLGEGE